MSSEARGRRDLKHTSYADHEADGTTFGYDLSVHNF